MTVEDVVRVLGDGPMTAPEIARALGCERTGIYRHLYALERAGAVEREPACQGARWLLAGQRIPEDWGRGRSARRVTPHAKAILDLLRCGPRTAPEIAHRIGASTTSVHRTLRRLEAAGLVRTAGYAARARHVIRWEAVA